MIYYKANNKSFEAYKAYLSDRSSVKRKWTKIMKEVGADDYAYCPSSLFFVGFKFKDTPSGPDWKKARNGFLMPKKTTKRGKELNKRLEEIKGNREVWKDLLISVGYGNAPFLDGMSGIMYYSPSMQKTKDVLLIGYPEKVLGIKEFQLPKGFKELTYSKYKELGGS